jgi:DNA processing protein
VIDAAELGAWIRLLETPGAGRESARKLLAAFGSPQAALDASIAQRTPIVGAAAAHALASPTPDLEATVTRTVAWLEADPGRRDVVTLGDERYPPLLLETADPPLLLYAQGRTELLRAPSIAVVGSRNPTPQGSENARAFAAHLGHAGWTVVSGLALGIDGEAHQGALETAAGTIAVVATGLDRVYPRRHRDLAHRIAEHGLIASEFALGTPPLQENFPIRNRIIAGLARGTLVVEAALQSGSLITARLALEAGRDVFAIPGSIHSPQSRGVHALIKQGAKLVDRADDILEELRMPQAALRVEAATTSPGAMVEPDDPLLAAIGYEPVSLDALVDRTGWAAAELNIRLLDLELEGRVARLPGQRFQRLARG